MVRKLFLWSIGMTLLGGCGYYGGDTPEKSTTNQYVGLTTPARITSANAKTLSENAYSTDRIVASATRVGKATTDVSSSPCLLQSFSSTLQGSVMSSLLRSSASNKIVASAIQQNISGSRGSLSYKADLDLKTGNFAGTLTFDQYQNTNTSAAITGTTDYSGHLEPTTSRFTTLNMRMNSLNATIAGGKSYTVSGTISFSNANLNDVSIASVVLTNNSTGSTHWFKDYQMTHTGNTLTIKGTYYEPTEGYVSMSTITPLSVAAADAAPLSGKLLLTGSDNTKARVTYTNSIQTVEADTAGSGTYTVIP